MATLRLQINEKLFLRDPQETALGRKIIQSSIKMIDELGLEGFTFKKLSAEIQSTEASIYRYFESKHKLLIYLMAWYWNWLEYQIDFATNNIQEPKDRLAIAMKMITEVNVNDDYFPDIDETALQRIVIYESDKAYLTKHVDDDNKDGSFLGYKSLCTKVASFIKEINPKYKYAHALTSTCLEASHQQIFFSRHLPRLTEHQYSEGSVHEDNYNFLMDMILKTIDA